MGKKGYPEVVSNKKFLSAIEKFRKKEKKNTRERDKLNAQRRRLPMTEVPGDYVFETPDGPRTLLELFNGLDQLIVYHFMYHPSKDSFCIGCSFVADHIPNLEHLKARDISFVMSSHAPMASIRRHKKRMGWDLPWVSAEKNRFNQDLGIDGDKHHELSVFMRVGKKVYRTYFTVARGVEYLGTPFALMDITPWGRQEKWENSPKGWPQGEPYHWWRLHDDYGSRSGGE